jgi:hypothetical protein
MDIFMALVGNAEFSPVSIAIIVGLIIGILMHLFAERQDRLVRSETNYYEWHKRAAKWAHFVAHFLIGGSIAGFIVCYIF